jgi:hypothetical protein
MAARRIKLILVLGLLAIGVVFHLSCGEGTLPPTSPPQTGQITVTGYAD